MTAQLSLFGSLPVPPPRGVTWERDARLGHATCGAHHRMLRDGVPTGWWVNHCGHPTANRPYYVATPDGEVLDRKYRLLADAKAAAVETINSKGTPT